MVHIEDCIFLEFGLIHRQFFLTNYIYETLTNTTSQTQYIAHLYILLQCTMYIQTQND